jgi:PAS domain S-box-containing protein
MLDNRTQATAATSAVPLAQRVLTLPDSIPAAPRYIIAVIVVGAATLLGMWLTPHSYVTPFLFFYPAVIIAVWVGGLRPGLLATLLASLAANRFLLPPYDRFSLDAANLIRTFAFGLTFASICWLTELARKQLSEGEKRWATTLRSIGDAVISTDNTGRVVFMNQAAEELTGWTLQEANGKDLGTVFEIINEETRQKPESPVSKVIRQRKVVGLANHTVLVRRDRTEIPIDDSGAPIFDQHDKLEGVVLVFRDISARKQAEERLAKSEQRYRLLFENLLGGFAYCKMIFDDCGNPEDFIYLDVNAAFGNLTGLEDVVGKRVSEVIPGIKEAHPELIETYGRVASTGHPERFEIHLKPLGKWLDVSVYSTQTGYFTAVFDNITQRKKAEQVLTDNEQELNAIYENAPLIMLLVNSEHRVCKANKFAEEFAGVSPSGLFGLRGGEALRCLHALADVGGCGFGPYCESCTVRGTILDTFATGCSHRQVEASLPVNIAGRDREVTFLLSTAGLKIREESQVLVTIQDITDRKQSEQALMRAEKLAATGRLAATIAHEINNPLEAMTNLVYLTGRSVTDASTREYLDLMEKQLQTISRITNQTLKFHRESGQPAEFRLSELIGELVDFYESKAKQHSVTVVKRVETEGKIVGFSGEIRQVISNLILNALEATPENGRVTVHLYRATDWRSNQHGYRVSIADTGTGIDSQHRARIFEPFFTTKGDKGTGLGLWVSIGIISRAGGSLRVWSTRQPGRSGTCFSVFLPAEVPPPVTSGQRRYETVPVTSHPA